MDPVRHLRLRLQQLEAMAEEIMSALLLLVEDEVEGAQALSYLARVLASTLSVFIFVLEMSATEKSNSSCHHANCLRGGKFLRIRHGSRQTLVTLIIEEVLLLAKNLRG